jgi:hypothetical protein
MKRAWNIGTILLGIMIFTALSGCNIFFPKGDTEPPTANITEPAEGDTLYEVATIKADAADNVGVLKVSFYVDSEWVGDDESEPYEYDWDCLSSRSGEHLLRVSAYDEEGNIGDSETVTVNVVSGSTGTGTGDIEAPSDLSASVDSDGNIELTWTDNSDDEEGFGIFRNTEEAYDTSEVIAIADVNAESYTDSYNLIEGETYYYFVVSYKDDVEVISDASNWASVYYTLVTELPAPASLSASNGTYSDKIDLSWNSVSGAAGYVLYRSTSSSGTYTAIGYIEGESATSTDNSVDSPSEYPITRGETYYYKVSAYDSGDNTGELSSYAAGWTATTLLWEEDENNWTQVYTIDDSNKGNHYWFIKADSELYTYNEYTIKVKRISGNEDQAYGAVFYYSDTDNFVAIYTTANQHFKVIEYVDGVPTNVLIDWTYRSELNNGYNTENVIDIDCNWNDDEGKYKYDIYFNGDLCAWVTAPASGRRCGFIATIASDESFPGTPADMRFKMTKPVTYPARGSRNEGAGDFTGSSIPGSSKMLEEGTTGESKLTGANLAP